MRINTGEWLNYLGDSTSTWVVDHSVPFDSYGNFISRPYRLSMEDLNSLSKFCSKHNLIFHVVGHSRYFPGRSLSLIINKEGKDELGGR